MRHIDPGTHRLTVVQIQKLPLSRGQGRGSSSRPELAKKGSYVRGSRENVLEAESGCARGPNRTKCSRRLPRSAIWEHDRDIVEN
jgi:hypothetical protein